MEYWEIIRIILDKYGRFHLCLFFLFLFNQLRIHNSFLSYSLTSALPTVRCLPEEDWIQLYTLREQLKTNDSNPDTVAVQIQAREDLRNLTETIGLTNYAFPVGTLSGRLRDAYLYHDDPAYMSCPRERFEDSEESFNESTTVLEECQFWIYDMSQSGFSLAVEQQLCNDLMPLYYYQVVILIAFALSWLLSYSFADIVGRRSLLLIYLGIDTLSSIISAFIRRFGVYIFFRFLSVFSVGGMCCVFSIYIIEIIPKTRRVFANFIFWSSFSFGYIWLAVLGALSDNNWFHLEIANLIINAVNIPMVLFLLPESPLWLFHLNKNKEARSSLSQIQRRQHRYKTDAMLDMESLPVEIVKEKHWDAFDNLMIDTKMTLNTVLIGILMTCHLSVYLCLSFNTNLYWGNPHVKLLFFGFVDLAGAMVCFLLSEKISPKTGIYALSILAAACFIIGDFVWTFSEVPTASVNVCPYIVRMACWMCLQLWPRYRALYYPAGTLAIRRTFFEIVPRMGVAVLSIIIIGVGSLKFCYVLTAFLVLCCIFNGFLPNVNINDVKSGTLSKTNRPASASC